ncbi:ADP-ribosylglycohydrolase family protein [Candidatus Poribacteria bacterium]|nr:ADP-ribosylglycohydrolase family protein [Candidatus Poribacteria bacterium]
MADRTYWENLIKGELVQRREEGCDIESIEKKFNEADRGNVASLEALFAELEALPIKEAFPYLEPSTLEEIRAERLAGPRRMQKRFTESELQNKILGAWLGRCAGCCLGKPVEGWHKERIENYLKLAGEYPLKNYFPIIVPIPEGYPQHLANHDCMQGRVQYMARDDDTDYTIMGLYILEARGLDFTTEDVANAWLNRLPYNLVYTAERIAYRNLVNGIKPPQSASYHNQCREWIGAQIRADAWGYVTPGWPEKGAEFGFRDAAVSHVKNGIYGEMFVSAMISAAFATDDIEEIINVALSEIPEKSRLTEAMKNTVEWSKECRTWQEAWKKVNEHYGHYHPVHTINNAAVVLLGLLYGEKDFGKTIGISVMGGWDTDCNGATAGSMIGAILGAKALPPEWVEPLNDRIMSYVIGFNDSKISDLANRTLAIAKKVLEQG